MSYRHCGNNCDQCVWLEKKISFVPTMGNLHKGHMALVDAARKASDFVVVSIFVNPAQFGDNEDLDAYPKTLARDTQLLENKIDLLFTPSISSIYPDGNASYVDIPSLTSDLCGTFRPIHFRGVLTVVNMLFNLIQPDYACFGKKDFQQMRLVERMVKDLHMDVSILEVDTGREESGLACSSRNQYLSAEEITIAPMLYTSLLAIRTAITDGDSDFDQLCQHEQQQLEAAGFQVDYLVVRDHATLQETYNSKHMIALVAARLGNTRLIDNIEISIR